MEKNNRIWSTEGTSKRMIAVRVLPGSDAVQGLIDACQKHGIKAGGIASMIGSFQNAQFMCIEPDPTSKTGASFTGKMDVEGPVELLSGQGLICDQDGDIFIHLHAVMVDKNQKVFGGHIERGYCTVLNTLEVIIVEGEDMILSRENDSETGFIQTVPKSTI
ncbi:PPC domain-containing DNA-binding protein [Natribacillus halophilus]|uniref:PPC domain-containing protein n=1 Tax=Natribacillus halophilus TaxID=549003 RepID=A0A1G8PCV6_9BACI|nr:PPC domain-containing DNA-binding protein [Natribacillus halophilus]SDI89570.1 hypothetical protein SAMN04488123_10837 [Natribacillus halophilus]